MQSKQITLDAKFCYPCYPIIEDQCIYIGIRFTNKGADINAANSYQIQKRDLESENVLWSIDLADGTLLCQPILLEEKILLSTESGLLALNKSNGKQVWKLKLKSMISHLTAIEHKIYLSNKNSIVVIDANTGKKIQQKKYRVKWLDSPIAPKENRFFVATSNSKIIEIDRNNLEILEEYKYPGGWAIANTPQFHNNQMICNSYAAYIMCFDLDTRAVLWRIKKRVGSEPNQLKTANFFYGIEILNNHKLTAINLTKGKKAWSKDYHVHALIEFDNDS